MILPDPSHDTRPRTDRGFWDAPDFGGHIHEGLELGTERMEDQ